MVNMTLVISDDLKKRMDEHSEVRWSNVVRTIIENKLDDFEKAEKLASKSKMTLKDAEEIAAKIGVGMGKHARRLLNENYGRR